MRMAALDAWYSLAEADWRSTFRLGWGIGKDCCWLMSEMSESFEEFKDSFSYGSRSDLAFKFLKRLDEEQAAAFLLELLHRLGDAVDDGSAESLVQLVYEFQARAYSGPSGQRAPEFQDAPFAALLRPLKQARLGLVTSTGHFVEGDDPQPFGVESMTQEEATRRILDFLRSAAQLSVIPSGTPSDGLRVRHGGYDIRGAQKDPNVVFPLDRLREFAAEGAFGSLAERAYSFVGATSHLRLVRETGPSWVERFKQDQLDAVLLVPA